MNRYAGLIFGVMMIAALALGGYAWQSASHPSVVVEWSTASELDTMGYNLYRSQSPGGPYTQVNDQLIPASGEPLTGGDYQYTDREVTPGQRYYYLLEDVDASGATSRNGPIEVTAQAGGRLELAAAGALAVFAILGGVWLLKARREKGV